MKPDTPNEWYFFIEGQQYGPYTVEEINQYLKDGRIDNQSLVWNSSLTDWLPLQLAFEVPTPVREHAKDSSKSGGFSKKPSIKGAPGKITKQSGGNLQKTVSGRMKGKIADLTFPVQPVSRWNVVVGEVLPDNPLVSIFGLDLQQQGKDLAIKAKATVAEKIKISQTSAKDVIKVNEIAEQPQDENQGFTGKGEAELSAIEWYMSRDGENYGPYNWEDLKDYSLSGRLQPDDLLWHGNLSDWIPAGRLKGLFSKG